MVVVGLHRAECIGQWPEKVMVLYWAGVYVRSLSDAPSLLLIIAAAACRDLLGLCAVTRTLGLSIAFCLNRLSIDCVCSLSEDN